MKDNLHVFVYFTCIRFIPSFNGTMKPISCFSRIENVVFILLSTVSNCNFQGKFNEWLRLTMLLSVEMY